MRNNATQKSISHPYKPNKKYSVLTDFSPDFSLEEKIIDEKPEQNFVGAKHSGDTYG